MCRNPDPDSGAIKALRARGFILRLLDSVRPLCTSGNVLSLRQFQSFIAMAAS
jgi:hypothetical protein